MPAKQTKLTEPERTRRIIEAAREAETDERPAALDRALKKIVRATKMAPKTK